MKGLPRLAALLLGATASVYFVAFACHAAARFDLRSLRSRPIGLGIVVAALSYASVVPTSSWAWGRLLRSRGISVSTLQLNMILGTSQIAKYLPGNIGQHVGRSALAIHRGIPAGALVLTLVAEGVLTIATAMVVGLVGLTIAGRWVGTIDTGRLGAIALAVLVMTVLLACVLVAAGQPTVLGRLLGPWLKERREEIPALRSAIGPALAAYTLNYVAIGVGLYAIARAAVHVSATTTPLFVGAFALSWVAGFVVPGAPAGLGVREGVLAALLAPSLDATAALQIIVAFRLATTLGDLLGLAWGGGACLVERRSRLAAGLAPPPGKGTDA
jgi:hypothetical protein